MLKQLGLISILSMWVATYALLKLHLPDSGKTISQHAAKDSRYHVTYALVEIGVSSLFTVFVFGWLIPTLKLNTWYTAGAIIGLLGTFIAAIIPDRAGVQRRVHQLGAYSMAMSLIVMNLALIASPTVSLIARTASGLGVTYMISGSLIALYRPSIYRKNALILQILYFMSFHIPILLAVYA